MKSLLMQNIGKEIKVQSEERGIFKIVPRSINGDYVLCDIVTVGKLGHTTCENIELDIRDLKDARHIMG